MIRNFINIIIGISALVLVIFGFSILDFNMEKDDKTFKTKLKIFMDKTIISGYKEAKNSVAGGILIFSIICEELLICIQCYEKYILQKKGTIIINIAICISKIGIASLFVLGIIGIILSLLAKVVRIIGSINNKKISNKLYYEFASLLLFTFAIGNINEIKQLAVLFGAGLIMCYVINMQMLFQIVGNSKCLESTEKKSTALVSCAVVLLSFILINLYLFVLLASGLFADAYINSGGNVISKWQLFYYTIISFSTIGYGDITPNNLISQLVAVLIAITSVVCLVIFISSVLSAIGDKSEE